MLTQFMAFNIYLEIVRILSKQMCGKTIQTNGNVKLINDYNKNNF